MEIEIPANLVEELLNYACQINEGMKTLRE